MLGPAPEHVDDHRVGQVPAGLDRLPAKDDRALRASPAQKLPRQSSFTDPWLSLDHDHLGACCLQGRLIDIDEPRVLAVPADQGHLRDDCAVDWRGWCTRRIGR
jgi:hypothetical protein